jgi:hypothetical protein
LRGICNVRCKQLGAPKETELKYCPSSFVPDPLTTTSDPFSPVRKSSFRGPCKYHLLETGVDRVRTCNSSRRPSISKKEPDFMPLRRTSPRDGDDQLCDSSRDLLTGRTEFRRERINVCRHRDKRAFPKCLLHRIPPCRSINRRRATRRRSHNTAVIRSVVRRVVDGSGPARCLASNSSQNRSFIDNSIDPRSSGLGGEELVKVFVDFGEVGVAAENAFLLCRRALLGHGGRGYGQLPRVRRVLSFPGFVLRARCSSR